ncbi:hypothetical protein WOLCODRAFT_149723 [Wolfiporia cocos MD-104 SS10]|uniref:F-box domain-containing protein n=1 Tax=Wolfiporia cocos (strain MD-104) TaxID=742152 RepID=A0A2H3JG19_WOLCO|nr:hypothetical protein WOLCODRAFT_149723 [Wolfiporia cocos MD-104 SS10]
MGGQHRYVQSLWLSPWGMVKLAKTAVAVLQPLFDSNGTVQTMPVPAPPPPASSKVPIEIWEQVIDILWDEPATLRSCLLVCRKWRDRSWYHLRKVGARSILHEREQVHQLAKLVRAAPGYRHALRTMYIGGCQGEREQNGIAHLGVFAAMLAGQLPCLEKLGIIHGIWRTGSMNAGFFLHLSALSSVTELVLRDVAFPSISIFGRFIWSFPNLDQLSIEGPITFGNPEQAHGEATRTMFPAKRICLRVAFLSEGITQALIVTTAAAHCTVLWLALESMTLAEVERAELQRLLRSVGRSVPRFKLIIWSPITTSLSNEDEVMVTSFIGE